MNVPKMLEGKRVCICGGSGGVGKTTTAAALGALAARLGRKTLVCTIDPAPRLADALGVGSLGPEARAVPPEACRTLGIDADEHEVRTVMAFRAALGAAFAICVYFGMLTFLRDAKLFLAIVLFAAGGFFAYCLTQIKVRTELH